MSASPTSSSSLSPSPIMNVDDAIPQSLLSGFHYTARSEPVNYSQIAVDSMQALGSADVAKGWAISLNLEGLKKKDGRSITIGASEHSYDSALASMRSFNELHGYSSGSVVSRIDTGKKAITPSRLARAFARVTIAYIDRKPASNKFPSVLSPSLPTKFRFLNSPYGMTDAELTEWGIHLSLFFENWDITIANAYNKGYAKSETPGTSSKRTWAEDFLGYIQFRGISI